MNTLDQSTTDLAGEEDEKPPVMGTWKRLYILVLVLHALIITGFYLLTRYYS